MVHNYLFFIKDGEIRTYRHKDGNFYLVKYKGEESCELKDKTFWHWWESSISFIPSDDMVDFCFVGDNIEDIYHHKYSTVTESEWTLGKIEDFLTHYLNEPSIQLSTVHSSQTLHLTKEPEPFRSGDVIELSFFTIPPVIIEEVKPKETNNEQNLRNYFLKELQTFN